MKENKVYLFCSSIIFRIRPTINYLLSDAEAGEDCGEDVLGGYCAGDFAQVVEGFAYVLGDEVARESHAEAVNGSGN